MIDHISLAVSDLARSTAFYESLLAPLELNRLITREGLTVGFGKKYPEFWLNAREGLSPHPESTGTHICLRAPSEEAIQTFHAAALAHGGKTAGDPGLRMAAFTIYFGAFIFDPDGNKIEAVYFPKKLGESAGFGGTAKLS